MAQFPAVIDLSTLNGSNGFKLNGVGASDFTGYSVHAAGDVNGDGFADVIVGAYGTDLPGKINAGASYVVFGKASGFPASFSVAAIDGTNGFKISGDLANDKSGYAVSAAGDVNGDGFADVIVGAYQADPGGKIAAGAAYVVFGHAGGFAANVDLSTPLNGSNGFKISGDLAGDELGRAVSSAGDVNGDGIADIIVGAPFADPHGLSSGASYVIFGHKGGFAANLDVSALNGSIGFKISGAAAGDDSGYSVSSAGDINGDGFADLLVGAYNNDPAGKANAGASYVVFGHAGGFAANIDVTSLTGANGFKISGDLAGDSFGYSVAAAGDINGDGLADIVVGAIRADPGGKNNAGASYVIFGSKAGFGANIDLSTPLNGGNGFKISGLAAGDANGYSVSTAGDVNGDGFADIIVSSYIADPGGKINAGETYVVFGHAGGFAPNLDLATLDGSNGFKLTGELAGDESGHSVSTAGDVNDDGFSDLIIGAPRNDPGAVSNAGAAYVVFGLKPTTAVTHFGTIAAQTLAGGDFKDVLKGFGGNDRLIGNGGKDKMDGGVGDDYLRGGLGRDTMTGGLGHDVFDFNAVNETGKGLKSRDVITDFKHKTDHIDLKDIDANIKKLGDQAFKYIGQADFHHVKGELHYFKVDLPGKAHDVTIVSGDINGDGKADFSIELSHLVTLTKVDFVL